MTIMFKFKDILLGMKVKLSNNPAEVNNPDIYIFVNDM